MAYAETLRASSEMRQLRNLMNYTAARSTELLTLTLATNATSESFLHLPSSIGDKQYWFQFRNDSTRAWLEGGLGDIPLEGTELRVYLPKGAGVKGYYVAGFGAAHLECYSNASFTQILLENIGGVDLE